MDHAKIILASASPRRRELLAYLGLPFEVIAGNIDETPRSGERARALVTRLATEKAQQVLAGHPQALVIAADTTVALEEDSSLEEILEKPIDEADAVNMLRSLSGRSHFVLTAIVLMHQALGILRSRLVTTEVVFRPLFDDEIARYVATKEPLDKAGAYGIQGLGGVFVEKIRGSYSNVVGLPLVELQQEMKSTGLFQEFPFAVPK